MNWDLFRRSVPVAILATGALVSTGALADGRCVTLEVRGTLVLPDGSIHEPGQLTLCRTMDFSPVATLHKTYVDVNEEGTEAAAVTAVEMGRTSAPPTTVVDRPFLFAIRERFSGTILFMGKIVDPTAG